jgi:predicted ATP-grasp superfamily ATP-dependent carboligase
MADERSGRRLRILLSEGSSTSAREAITALAAGGHHVEICDPDPFCLGRFSRLVAKFHRCPPLRDDPAGYLAFVLDLLARRSFDVLLPIHEQGFLFACVAETIAAHVAIALPSFASYKRALGKADFYALLDELALSHPQTAVMHSAAHLAQAARYPCVVKMAYATASRGTWIVKSPADLAGVQTELAACRAFDHVVLLQEFVAGTVEHAQALFDRGALVAAHGYRQIAMGAGGGDAAKESVLRPAVVAHMQAIGARLVWHGALSLDYIWPGDGTSPLYIDCNPRLVEPMSAALAGVDLAGLLVAVSCGAAPRGTEVMTAPRDGVRSHLAMQALLGSAIRTGRRAAVLAQCRDLALARGLFRDSREELTPVRADWVSAVPLAITALALLINPGWGARLAKGRFGNHLLAAETIRLIEQGIAVEPKGG